jgi:hypothetical protein
MRKLVLNKRALTALALVVGVALLLGGGLTASNMGFKLNRVLSTTGPGSNSGLNTISLPYNRQVGIDNASDLFGDIGFANIQLLSRFLPATDTFQNYALGSPDFALAQGQGYLAKMAVTTNYIIVGSHDPGAVIQLNAAGGGSNSGLNFFAPPYHSTANLASELFGEIGFTNIQLLSRLIPATDTFQNYALGSPDFAIVPGEAYFLKMAANLAYSPSHY